MQLCDIRLTLHFSSGLLRNQQPAYQLAGGDLFKIHGAFVLFLDPFDAPCIYFRIVAQIAHSAMLSLCNQFCSLLCTYLSSVMLILSQSTLKHEAFRRFADSCSYRSRRSESSLSSTTSGDASRCTRCCDMPLPRPRCSLAH